MQLRRGGETEGRRPATGPPCLRRPAKPSPATALLAEILGVAGNSIFSKSPARDNNYRLKKKTLFRRSRWIYSCTNPHPPASFYRGIHMGCCGDCDARFNLAVATTRTQVIHWSPSLAAHESTTLSWPLRTVCQYLLTYRRNQEPARNRKPRCVLPASPALSVFILSNKWSLVGRSIGKKISSRIR